MTALTTWQVKEIKCSFRLVLKEKTGKEISELSFWEQINSSDLLPYTSLAASKTRLQQFLVCLNFTLDSEDLFCWYKQKTAAFHFEYISFLKQPQIFWNWLYKKKYLKN